MTDKVSMSQFDNPNTHPRLSVRLTINDQDNRFVAQVHARGRVYVGPCAGPWLNQLRNWTARDGYVLVNEKGEAL